MYRSHYEKYLSKEYDLHPREVVESECGNHEIKEGTLVSKTHPNTVPIKDFIPRFVPEANYADNFGLQWNKFRSIQLDSYNGLFHSFVRFWTNTKWQPKDLFGKTVLEVGCGAGRFTEVLLNAGAEVVAFDYSNAVVANYKNNKNERLFLFQGDLYDIPLPTETFDYVFCYGVLQHTPDPQKSFYSILRHLKPGGRFSVDIYRAKYRRLSPWYTPKVLWRPITTRMDPEKLMKIIEFYIPKWLPIDTFIRKIPLLGWYLLSVIPIPCWNYLSLPSKIRLNCAILDTYDALAAAYDIPKTKAEVEAWCNVPFLKDVEIFYGSNGVVANGTKKAMG